MFTSMFAGKYCRQEASQWRILQPHPVSKPLDICRTPDRGWWSVPWAAWRTSAKVIYGTWLGNMWCFDVFCGSLYSHGSTWDPQKLRATLCCITIGILALQVFHKCAQLPALAHHGIHKLFETVFRLQGVKGRGVIESMFEIYMLHMTVQTLGSTVGIAHCQKIITRPEHISIPLRVPWWWPGSSRWLGVCQAHRSLWTSLRTGK